MISYKPNFLFHKVKTTLKGKIYHDAENIKMNKTCELHAVHLHAFSDCVMQLLESTQGNQTIFFLLSAYWCMFLQAKLQAFSV